LKASDLTEERLKQIRELNEIAQNRGQTLAQMALSWILRDGEVTSVLIGASKPQQIVENLGIIHKTRFTKEELADIECVSGK
jgi:L-glyceraldehyde 3-phosphate reductase